MSVIFDSYSGQTCAHAKGMSQLGVKHVNI